MSSNELEPAQIAEAFVDAFNSIDRHLRHELGLLDRNAKSFSDVLREFERRKPAMRSLSIRLHDFARLRNVLVHDRYGENEYFAYPFRETLQEIKKLEGQLKAPATAFQHFQTGVKTVESTLSVHELLNIIRETQITQFPVYGDSQEFVGLVSSNGLAHWLAMRPGDEEDLIDWTEHTVGDVLELEETRNNFLFVGRNTPLLEVVEEFRVNPGLEAVLITDSGSQTQKLLGIASRWDMASQDWTDV